jgi:hypothetical protein
LVSEKVRDFLDLPEHASVDDFIVKPDSSRAALARSYTLTSAIRPKLDQLLRDVEAALARNEDLGRFVFGSFGSGKSHFLRVAAMMLAGDPDLYEYARDASLRAVRDAHPFLEKALLLVVETTMIGVNEEVSAFTRRLTDDFDRAMVAHGKPALRAFGTSSLFDAFDKLVVSVPQTMDAFEKSTGYTRLYYEEMRTRAQTGLDVAAFARDVARFYGIDEQSFLPTEAEAREQMAAHAHLHGFRGIVFAIDEFVLWAQGLSGPGYVGAVNALNALVESAEKKPVRFFVLAAIQRNISHVFPADTSETVLREQLNRAKDRFPEIYLEDSNLFEITEKRVLAPRPEKASAWKSAVAQASSELAQGGRSVLLGDEPATTLMQLYPFHPALLRVLSDVSQGLHRARSSLFMLYQLLTDVRPDLEVGQLVSLGALWDVLFSTEHVQNLESYAPGNDPNHRANLLLKTYETWVRLRASIAAVGENEAGTRMLDLGVKSALLAQLSHTGFLENGLRPLDRAVTIENLFRLNRADVPAINERSGMLRSETLFTKLAAAEPGTVTLDGNGASTIVRVELSAIDLGELLAALRPPTLFPTLLKQVKDALGFGAGFAGQEGRLTTTFRSTDRSGRVRFESFSQFTAAGRTSTLALEPNDEFKLAILLENETSGNAQQAIDNKRAEIESARDQTQTWAAAWIPGPLSQEGRDALEALAKAELFEDKPDDYLGRFKAVDHSLVRQKMGASKIQAQTTLRTALLRAYGEGGRVFTMRKDPADLNAPPNIDVDARAKWYALQLLDRRYPQHPRFSAAPVAASLTKLIALDQRLSADAKNNTLIGDEVDVAKKLGDPLELFEPGSGVANVKPGGLYLERLREWVRQGERSVERLMKRLAGEPVGLSALPAQALIAVLANRDAYRIILDGRPLTIDSPTSVDRRATLERGSLVPLTTWNTARSAASMLFELADIPAAHSMGNTDVLIERLRGPLDRNLETLRRCTAAFDQLAARKRYTGESIVADRYRAAQRDLATLLDENKRLERLAALDIGPYVTTLGAATNDAAALESLGEFEFLDVVLQADEGLRGKLQRDLTDDLPVLAPSIERWLDDARTFVKTVISKPLPPAAPPTSPPATDTRPGQSNGAHDEVTHFTERLALPASASHIDALLGKIREQITAESGPGEIMVDVRFDRLGK